MTGRGRVVVVVVVCAASGMVGRVSLSLLMTSFGLGRSPPSSLNRCRMGTMRWLEDDDWLFCTLTDTISSCGAQ